MPKIDNLLIRDILLEYDYSQEFFEKYNIDTSKFSNNTINEMLNSLDVNFIEDNTIEVDSFTKELEEYNELMSSFFQKEDISGVEIEILPGNHKDGSKENFKSLSISKGEIVAIVGPTGSGKSRLLADIEYAANNDTPTGRIIKVNNEIVDSSERFNVSNRLVAQLSQNMNFIMDVSVEEFLDLHASSRLIPNKEEIINKIFNKAINLAGEKFTLDTPVTSLSGGQSRALMIADTAYLSKSPIVLIDEIENAGIDRRRALELLVGEEKIVLMATHDPILALMADKRIIIKNGGISDIIATSEEEKKMLLKLEHLDSIILGYRNDIRLGKQIKLKEEL